MGLNLEQKKAVVAEVSEVASAAETAILAEYRGLTVAQMSDLRRNARNAGVTVRVVKNTLARRAFEGTDFECLNEQLSGPLTLAMSDDPAAAAKALHDFAKDNEALKIKAGAMGGKLLSDAEIVALAKLPTRDELLGKLAGTMQAPIQKFVQTLNEVPGSFVRVLAAVRDQKQAA